MNNKKTRGRGVFVILVLCGLLVSCAPLGQRVFKLGANNWLGYQPFFTAQNNGYWDGDQVSVIELGSATEVIRALATHSLDAAAMTLEEAIFAKSRDQHLQVVMVLDFSQGGDVLIAKPELKSLSDLRGKVIGVENTPLGALMLDAILKRANLQAEDIRIRPVTYDQHVVMLTSGELDAVITFEPARSQLLAAGFRDLFNSSAIPGMIVDVLVVSKPVLDRYPDRLTALISGYLAARKLVLAQHSATIAGIAKRTKVSPEAVISGLRLLQMPGLDENKQLLEQCASGLAVTADKIMTVMLESGIIRRPVNLANLCNSRLIQEVSI